MKHVRAHLQNPKRASGWDVSWLANIVKEADARPFVTVCSREKVYKKQIGLGLTLDSSAQHVANTDCDQRGVVM